MRILKGLFFEGVYSIYVVLTVLFLGIAMIFFFPLFFYRTVMAAGKLSLLSSVTEAIP